MIINKSEAYGFDISKYQSDPVKRIMIDFKKIKNYGATFVIPKIGQNNYYDYDAEYNWRASKDAGLLRGSYWFLSYLSSPKAQAQKAVEFFNKFGFGEGTHFIDFEAGSGGRADDVYNYMVEYQRLTGCPNEKLGVYTSFYYWMENALAIEQRKWFAQYPLWLAWYLKNAPITSVQEMKGYYLQYASQVRTPDAWKDDNVLFWQAGTPSIGKQVGAQSFEIDFNLLNGDMAKLAKYFDMSVVIEEPPVEPPSDGGNTTMYNLIVLAKDLNGRSSPSSLGTGNINFPAGTSYPTTGFHANDILEADATQKDTSGVDWYRITKCMRNSVAITIPSPVWASAGATYSLMRLYTPTPPVTEPAKELFVSLAKDGTQYKYVLVQE